jgi:hypothetical protein
VVERLSPWKDALFWPFMYDFGPCHQAADCRFKFQSRNRAASHSTLSIFSFQESFIMFYWLNCVDAVLCQIEWAQHSITRIQPYAQSAWQVVTDKKTQRILRAIGLALFVLGTILLVGMVQVGRTAWQEAAKVFRGQLDPTGDECSEAPEIVVCPSINTAIAVDVVSPQTGVRTLRQMATRRGIRNAARMRKPELLALLQLA